MKLFPASGDDNAERKLSETLQEAVCKLSPNDPRLALVVGVSWWLVRRRRRIEQQRIRRRSFYRRWKRIVILRKELQQKVPRIESVHKVPCEIDQNSSSHHLLTQITNGPNKNSKDDDNLN